MPYTYEKTSNLVKTGDYEARLENIERKTLPSGAEKLSLMWRVRDDIEGQSYGNKVLFEDIWKEKQSPEHFNRKRINQLLGTQNVKEGTVFNNINDIITFMVGRNAIIHVDEVFDDYRGEDVNKISYYKTSNNQPKKLGDIAPATPSSRFADDDKVVNDEDLPW